MPPVAIKVFKGYAASTNCLPLSHGSVLRQSRPWAAKDTIALRSQ
ncbi:MAG: hypothetical protein RMZ41_023025 [Nostoc sp. DedVER02]